MLETQARENIYTHLPIRSKFLPRFFHVFESHSEFDKSTLKFAWQKIANYQSTLRMPYFWKDDDIAIQL